MTHWLPSKYVQIYANRVAHDKIYPFYIEQLFYGSPRKVKFMPVKLLQKLAKATSLRLKWQKCLFSKSCHSDFDQYLPTVNVTVLWLGVLMPKNGLLTEAI